ncbi:SDR family NAD(P)-dependent oxidoreductase [Nocardia yunnanensis]|uniref:SDR family NAD(P)-dependent oxidoreductase n=2 Tax=Nocardia yunnanensis TaxID=2382165 RepID=A0A386ZBT6_9NOCA|nr:SDR family NAD(P)-dependent oxidoreductase [Nocardia yunnanensis]
MTRTYLVTGSASGIGAATVDYLRERGAHVIGADRHEADITVDLATDEGRAALVEQASDLAHGHLDAVIASAGVGLLDPVTVTVNYFGAVATLEGLRPLLAAGTDPRAVVVSSFAALLPSNPRLVEAALAGDEVAATKIAEEAIALLYAQPLTLVVVRLTFDDVSTTAISCSCVWGEPASPVPGPVTDILRSWIDSRTNINTATNRASCRLIPGR